MTTTRASLTVMVPLLLLAIISGLGVRVRDAFASDITITGQFNFRDHSSANPAGIVLLDSIAFGATSITPSGSGTTVQAVQAATTLGLPFAPRTIFPDQYVLSIAFNLALTGAWTLTATDAAVRSRS